MPNLNPEYFQPDGVHPNAKAQKLIAQGLLDAFAEQADFECSEVPEVLPPKTRCASACVIS